MLAGVATSKKATQLLACLGMRTAKGLCVAFAADTVAQPPRILTALINPAVAVCSLGHDFLSLLRSGLSTLGPGTGRRRSTGEPPLSAGVAALVAAAIASFASRSKASR